MPSLPGAPCVTRLVTCLTVGALLAGLAACDQPTRPEPTTDPSPAMLSPEAQQRLNSLSNSCNVGRIYQLVTLLAPRPMDDPPYNLAGAVTITLTLAGWQVKPAQQAVIAIATALANPRIQSKLGGTSVDKLKNIAELTNDLFGCVGLGTTAISPTAYGAGGTVTAIGPAGGTATTADQHTALILPAGAVATNSLVAIAPIILPAGQSCLSPNSGVTQVGRCYEFTITPAVPLNDPNHQVIAAFCTDGVVETDPVHASLRVSKQHGEQPPVIFNYVPAPTTLDCTKPYGTAALKVPLGERLFGSAWQTMTRAATRVAQQFEVKRAYAVDGVGGRLCEAALDACLLSTFTLVAPALVVTHDANISVGVERLIVSPPPGVRDVSGPYVWSVRSGEGAAVDGGNAALGLITADGNYGTYSLGTGLPAGGSVQICARLAAGTSVSRAPLPGCLSETIPGLVTGVSTTVDKPNVALTSCAASTVLTFTGSITTNAAGTVTYTFDRSDGAIYTGPTLSVYFEAAGTQTVTTTWTLGVPGPSSTFSGWQRVHTLTPNAMVSQGDANFTLTCPS